MLNKFNKTSLNKRSHQLGVSSLVGKINGAIALGLMLLVLPACEADTQSTTTTETETAPTMTPETETTMTPGTTTTTTPGTEPTMTPGMSTTTMVTELEEVAENPNQFMGQTVTVNGQVAEVLGPNVFRIQEDQAVGGDDVIVITTGSEVPLTEDSQVQVTGEVRQLVITEIEREYDLGWDDTLRTDIEREYTDRPAIVAKSVQPMPNP